MIPQQVSLIPTITSTDIQKIVFSPFSVRDGEGQFWSSLDTGLSSLVDRLRASGHHHVLDVDFRRDVNFAKRVLGAGPDGFLPKFRERGRVTILETPSERVLYCSDASIGSSLGFGDVKRVGN